MTDDTAAETNEQPQTTEDPPAKPGDEDDEEDLFGESEDDKDGEPSSQPSTQADTENQKVREEPREQSDDSPPSVSKDLASSPKLLEGGILAKLKALPPNLANDALQEYDDALQIKGGSIRNQGAYLYGVIKRYTSVHERATTGGEGTHILPMGEGLTPIVNAKLETLVSTGFCTRAEMNEKVKSKIRMLSEKDALFAIDELASTDRASIRNFGSFFMGILNRYMRGDTQSRHDPPALHPSSSSFSSSRTNRFDRNNNSSGNRERSRDRGPPPPKYGGRFQQQHSNQQFNNPTYDPRQQQQRPPWNQQGSVPPPPPQQQQPYNAGPPSNYPPPAPYQQQQPPQPPNQFVPTQGGFPPPNMAPGFPPQQMQQGYVPNNPQMMGQTQPSYNTGNAPPYQQQPPYNNSQVQYPPQPPQRPPYNSWQPQQQQPQPPPQQQGQMLDILALADKASSAVQALAGQAMPASQRGPYGQQQQQQQYPYNAPQQQPPFQQGPPSYPPQQQQQQQQPAYGSPPGMPQPAQQYGSSQRRTDNRSRHTTATVDMLTPQVQYAVKNLIATGQVERVPDDGILGMIYDLPEALALSSLQKFATIDKSSMRSRIAYLAGVLRRELENIGKR
eukprot:scaffold1522_cov166-Amphora_coffeaeformis.AAC.10